MSSPGAVPVTFRSRKVGSLLAYLALNRGKEISNSFLQDLLWPDSDGDRQGQSLRRAISDLRDVLEDDSTKGKIVLTDRGKISIDASAFESDTDQFTSLLSESTDRESADIRLTGAVAMYGGALLMAQDDDWVFAYRRQYEEMYCGAVVKLCEALIQRGLSQDAVRIANAAVILAPTREEVHICAIQSYAAQGNQTMALRQFEALEMMLDDHFGQTPSDLAIAALNSCSPDFKRSRAAPPTETAAISSVQDSHGGAILSDSRFYIERNADQLVMEAVHSKEPVTLVFGPRQTGKTSLLARTVGVLRNQGSAVVVTDFQSLSKLEVQRATSLYRALVHNFASQLGLIYEPSWNEWIGPNSNLDALIESLLKKVNQPVCWAMDEVDRLFGTDYTDDFFGLIRSWHNRRALDPNGPWQKLNLIISYATEAQLFITDLNQSPFNIGFRVNLRDFTESEVAALAARYHLTDASASTSVFEITNGHPFLSRRALSFLQQHGSLSELRESASHEDGPFGEHLRHLLHSVTRDHEIKSAIRGLLDGTAIQDSSTRFRLWSAGVLSTPHLETCQFRVPTYATYLRNALS